MPFVLLLIGGVLMLASVRGDPNKIGTLFARDLSGAQGFATFAAAFMLVGFAGYIGAFRDVSRMFLALMVVALVLAYQRRGGNLFGKLKTQWAEITAPPIGGANSGRSQ